MGPLVKPEDFETNSRGLTELKPGASTRLSLAVVEMLDGIAVWEARLVLDEAKRIVNTGNTHNVNSPNFKALKAALEAAAERA